MFVLDKAVLCERVHGFGRQRPKMWIMEMQGFMAGKYYAAGVDGGGTKTECAIVDQDGNTIAIGHGGPSNIFYTDVSKAIKSFEDAVDSAIEKAGGDIKIALTGCTHRALRDPAEREKLSRRTRGEVRSYSEAVAAFGSAGLFERFGIALVAGTGSSAFMFSPDGNNHIVGGWGSLIGDEGSAYDIAIRGIRAAVRMIDGRGGETSLLDLACKHFKISPGFEPFIRFTHDATRDRIASFAKVVTSAARDGDAVAIGIVNSAIESLAECVIVIAKRQFAKDNAFPVALHGGMMKDNMIVEGVTRLIKESFPNADMKLPIHRPGVGLALFVLRDLKRETSGSKVNG